MAIALTGLSRATVVNTLAAGGVVSQQLQFVTWISDGWSVNAMSDLPKCD